MPLQPYRRHLKTCPHGNKGQSYTLCRCPIWAYGNVNGVQIRRSLGTDDAARALRRIDVLEKGGELAPVGSDSPTVIVAVADFLTACRNRQLRQSTIDSYETILDHLTAALGTRQVGTIDPPTLDRYRTGRTIAAGTWRKELETLRAFFTWCADRKWVTDNPARRLKMPPTELLTTLPFTAEEIQQLLRAADLRKSTTLSDTSYIRKRARAIIMTMLYSGLRVSDVAQLRRDALRGDHLTLRAMKNNVPLKVLLHTDAIAALNALPAVSTEYFFWAGRGSLQTCIKGIRKTVQKLGAASGIHAHPHRFRDTFAVELLTRGADIRTVQLLLGHTSVRTTERHYAHFVAAHQARLDAAAATLDFQPPAGRPLLMQPGKNRRRDAK